MSPEISDKHARILLATTDGIMNSVVQSLFQKRELPAFLITVSTVGDVYKVATKDDFDLIYIDFSLPGGDIFSLVENILVNKKNAKILVVADFPVRVFTKVFLSMGCYGYIGKSVSTEEMFLVLKKIIVEGKKYISTELILQFGFESGGGPKKVNPFETLTLREIQIVTHLLMGKKNMEISQLLNLHFATIRFHKIKIYVKLKVKSLIELKKLAEKFKLL